jgi:quinol monooxygenase YgiN
MNPISPHAERENDTMSLRVIARVAAKTDRVEQVGALLIGVVEPTRREPGCLGYQLLQNQADPTDFTFIEEWTSAAAEQSHFATPHISNALRQLPELLAMEPDVRRYTVLK